MGHVDPGTEGAEDRQNVRAPMDPLVRYGGSGADPDGVQRPRDQAFDRVARGDVDDDGDGDGDRGGAGDADSRGAGPARTSSAQAAEETRPRCDP